MSATQSTVMNDVDPHGFGAWLSPAGLASLFVAIVGAIPIILGVIGGTVALAYYVIAIWESETVKSWVQGRHARRLAKRVAVLQMKQAAISAELKLLGVLKHADTTFIQQDDVHKSVTTVETETPAPKK